MTFCLWFFFFLIYNCFWNSKAIAEPELLPRGFVNHISNKVLLRWFCLQDSAWKALSGGAAVLSQHCWVNRCRALVWCMGDWSSITTFHKTKENICSFIYMWAFQVDVYNSFVYFVLLFILLCEFFSLLTHWIFIVWKVQLGALNGLGWLCGCFYSVVPGIFLYLEVYYPFEDS